MYEDTVRLLKESTTPLPKIAEDCEISLRLLHYLRSGEYRGDPGVRKIERLHHYLSGETTHVQD